MVRIAPALVLGVALVGAAPWVLSAQLRSATAAAAISPTGSTAVLSYTVAGRTARVTIHSGDTGENYTTTAGSLRLVDVPGEAYPLLFLHGAICGRDCEDVAHFFRYSPGAPSLKEVATSALDANDPAPSGASACFAPGKPELLYQWTYNSAIPIRPHTVWRYFAVPIPDRGNVILQTMDVDAAALQAMHLRSAKETPRTLYGC